MANVERLRVAVSKQVAHITRDRPIGQGQINDTDREFLYEFLLKELAGR